MSATTAAPSADSSDRVVKESTWTEVKGGLIAIGAWEIFEKLVSKTFDLLKEHLGGAAKEAITQVVIDTIKKPFKEIRNELYGYIQYYLRGYDEKAADMLIAHIHRPNRKQPLKEYRTWAVLMGLYQSLQDLKEETERLQVFSVIARMSAVEFDKMVDDLTHDPVKQFFDWLKSQPLWRQALVYWRAGNRKAFWGVMLIMGEPVVLILFGLAAGFFLHGRSIPWPLYLLGTLGIGLAAFWAFLKLNERSRQAEREANEAEEADGEEHEPESREFPWTSVAGWGAMGLILPALLLALAQDDKGIDWLYIIPWFIGAAMLAGVLWLIFSDHPIAALGVHFAGRVPKYGTPVRVGLYGLGSVIGADFIFTVAFPFFHFEEHNRLAMLALGFILFFYLSTYTFHRAYQALAFAALLGMLLYGLWNNGGKDWYEKAVHWLEPKSEKAVVVERQPLPPGTSPAEVHTAPKVSAPKPHHRAAQAVTVAIADSIPPEVYTAEYHPPAETEVRKPRQEENLPDAGRFEGRVVPCYMGDIPNSNRGEGRLCLELADGTVVGAHYDLDSLIRTPANQSGHYGFTVPYLKRGQLVRVDVWDGWVKGGVLLP